MTKKHASLVFLVGTGLVAAAACGGPSDTTPAPDDAAVSPPSDAGSEGSSGSSSGSSSGAVQPDSGSGSSSSSSSGSSSSGSSGGSSSGTPTDAGSGEADAGTPLPADPPFSGPITNGTVTVTPGNTIAQIGPGFVGLSYEKSHLLDGFFRADNTALIAMLQMLGPSVLRVGGGTVDTHLWEPAGFDAGAPITKADVDGFAALVRAAGWTGLYGLPLKVSTPAAAAEEAAYASAQLGSSLYGFEIGNEPDLYKITYSAFKTEWESFASAIQAGGAGPKAPLTGPVAAGNSMQFTVPFAMDEASRIVLLTEHYYRANGTLSTSTLDLLLAPDPGLVTYLQAGVAAATANHIPKGFRLAECNSFSHGGANGVSDEFGTALWAIDFLFTNARYGSIGVNFHGGGNTAGYTPIADNGSTVVEARPLYYGMLLFTQAGTGAMLDTRASAGSLNLTAYAIGRSDGSISVVLVNKDPTNGVQASVDMGAAVGAAGAIYLQAPSLAATTGVTLAGAGVSAMGAWSPSVAYAPHASGHVVSVLVPPASAALVSIR